MLCLSLQEFINQLAIEVWIKGAHNHVKDSQVDDGPDKLAAMRSNWSLIRGQYKAERGGYMCICIQSEEGLPLSNCVLLHQREFFGDYKLTEKDLQFHFYIIHFRNKPTSRVSEEKRSRWGRWPAGPSSARGGGGVRLLPRGRSGPSPPRKEGWTR